MGRDITFGIVRHNLSVRLDLWRSFTQGARGNKKLVVCKSEPIWQTNKDIFSYPFKIYNMKLRSYKGYKVIIMLIFVCC